MCDGNIITLLFILKYYYMENEMRKLIDQVKNFGKSLNENVGNTTYAIYLGTDIIYNHLSNERLKSVLYSLVKI